MAFLYKKKPGSDSEDESQKQKQTVHINLNLNHRPVGGRREYGSYKSRVRKGNGPTVFIDSVKTKEPSPQPVAPGDVVPNPIDLNRGEDSCDPIQHQNSSCPVDPSGDANGQPISNPSDPSRPERKNRKDASSRSSSSDSSSYDSDSCSSSSSSSSSSDCDTSSSSSDDDDDDQCQGQRQKQKQSVDINIDTRRRRRRHRSRSRSRSRSSSSCSDGDHNGGDDDTERGSFMRSQLWSDYHQAKEGATSWKYLWIRFRGKLYKYNKTDLQELRMDVFTDLDHAKEIICNLLDRRTHKDVTRKYKEGKIAFMTPGPHYPLEEPLTRCVAKQHVEVVERDRKRVAQEDSSGTKGKRNKRKNNPKKDRRKGKDSPSRKNRKEKKKEANKRK